MPKNPCLVEEQGLQSSSAVDPRRTSSAFPQRKPMARQRGAYSRISKANLRLAGGLAAGEYGSRRYRRRRFRHAETQGPQAPHSSAHAEDRRVLYDISPAYSQQEVNRDSQRAAHEAAAQLRRHHPDERRGAPKGDRMYLGAMGEGTRPRQGI